MPNGKRPRRCPRGFTYLGLLFAVVLLGVVLAVVGVFWHTQARREKEMELLFVGMQYRQAIAAYHAVSINGVQRYPASLDDLLEDRRFPMPVRHLRRRYADPLAPATPWGLVRLNDGIVGIHSQAAERPLKTAGFADCCTAFASAKHYYEWIFAADGGDSPAPAAPAGQTPQRVR